MHDEFIDYLYHKPIFDVQNKFITSKKRTESFLKFYDKKGYDFLTKNTIENVKNCGSWLYFRNYYRKLEVKLHTANFCKKDKLCSACASRRAFKQIQKITQLLEENEALKKKNWYYIVLPVKHNKDESFSVVFERLRQALQNMRTRIKTNKRTKKKSFFNAFDGMFYSYEVTKTVNGWNCHVNLLGATSENIPLSKLGKSSINESLMNEWMHYTDNQSYIHNIAKVEMNHDNAIKNLFEVFKYILKFQDLSNEDLAQVYQETYRKRMLGAIGCFYNMKVEEVEFEDEVIDTEFIEMIYKYHQKSNQYRFFQERLVTSEACEICDL